MKKLFSTVLTFLLACGLCFAFAGCDTEEQIERQHVTLVVYDMAGEYFCELSEKNDYFTYQLYINPEDWSFPPNEIKVRFPDGTETKLKGKNAIDISVEYLSPDGEKDPAVTPQTVIKYKGNYNYDYTINEDNDYAFPYTARLCVVLM